MYLWLLQLCNELSWMIRIYFQEVHVIFGLCMTSLVYLSLCNETFSRRPLKMLISLLKEVVFVCCSFVRTFVRLYTRAFVHSYISTFVRLFVCLFFQSVINAQMYTWTSFMTRFWSIESNHKRISSQGTLRQLSNLKWPIFKASNSKGSLPS